jgi:beta-N-acetylhexosaminidase
MKRIIIGCLILIVIVFFSLFFPQSTLKSKVGIKLQTKKTLSLAEKLLALMTLEDKVGQMFVVGFDSTAVNDNLKKMIKADRIGGVVFLKKNIINENQLKDLIKSLQKEAALAGYQTPLFIAVDQEGGAVSRVDAIKEVDITAQSEIKTEEEAYRIGKKRGDELRKLGFNMNFSPVIDYTTDRHSFIFGRVFFGQVDFVAMLGSSMIKGYQEAGIIPVPKHFPGHWNSPIDPHQQIPIITAESKELNGIIAPFEKIIKKSHPQAIMLSHTFYPGIDSQLPASLSPVVINDILKERLGFKGVIISDDLSMKAVSDNYFLTDASNKAIIAGNDIVLYLGNYNEATALYQSVIEGVKNNEIGLERVDESVLKILKLKLELGERKTK